MADESPPYVHFFGVMGATAAMVFSGKNSWANTITIRVFAQAQGWNIECLLWFLALGAAYGTAKSGTGIAAMSVMRPELIMKSIIPVVMAGIIAIYGLVVAVLIGTSSKFCSVIHINWLEV